MRNFRHAVAKIIACSQNIENVQCFENVQCLNKLQDDENPIIAHFGQSSAAEALDDAEHTRRLAPQRHKEKKHFSASSQNNYN